MLISSDDGLLGADVRLGDILRDKSICHWQIVKATSQEISLQRIDSAGHLLAEVVELDHDFLAREINAGRFLFMFLGHMKPAAGPAKWSCGHKKLDTDKHCPVCAAFGRQTTT